MLGCEVGAAVPQAGGAQLCEVASACESVPIRQTCGCGFSYAASVPGSEIGLGPVITVKYAKVLFYFQNKTNCNIFSAPMHVLFPEVFTGILYDDSADVYIFFNFWPF